jgi:autotransporter adhesin
MQPAILWRFFVSKQIHFPKHQVAVALASALAAGNVAAETIVNGIDIDAPVNGAYTSVRVNQWAAVAYNVPANTPSNITSPTGYEPIYDYNTTPVTSYTALERVNQTLTQTTGGSVLQEGNGNLTLTGGSTNVSTRSYWNGVTWEVVNNVPGPSSNVTGVVENFVGPADYTFNVTSVANIPWQVQSSTYNGGGDLTMDGNAQIRDGIVVSTRGTGDDLGVANYGGGRLEVSANTAKIGMITPGLPNSAFRGLTVTPTQTTLSGGTGTTSLVLSDSGAAFSTTGQSATKVTGVAPGTSAYDAVNYAQFSALQGDFNSAYSSLKRDIRDVENKAYGGIAAAVALAGIPAPAAGKQYTVGAGWGNYEGENAFALGGRAQVTPEFQLTAGWGYSSEGNAFNVGAGYSR